MSEEAVEVEVHEGFPFPRLTAPPDPQNLGDFLTTFRATVSKAGFDKFGNFELRLVVAAESKYAAIPLTDVPGRNFYFLVHARPGREATVDQGVLRVQKVRAERAKTREQRNRDRAWRRAKVLFVGSRKDEL